MTSSRRLGYLAFCALSALNTAHFSTQAAPVGRLEDIRGRSAFQPHARRDEIADLVANITGKPVSNNANLAQSLGDLFGGGSSSSPSSASMPPAEPSWSDPTLATPPEYTSTANLPLPTGSEADSDPDATVAGAILSELDKLFGANGTLPPGAIPSSGAPSNPGPGTPGAPWGSTDDGYPTPPSQPAGGEGGGFSYSDCAEFYTVVSGDDCGAITSVFELTPADFVRMNPSVGAACANLRLGQQYCVQRNENHGWNDGDDYDYGDEDDEDEDDDGKQVTVIHIDNPFDSPQSGAYNDGTCEMCQVPGGGEPSSGNPVPIGEFPSPPIPPIPYTPSIESDLPAPTVFPPLDSPDQTNPAASAASSLSASIPDLALGDGFVDPEAPQPSTSASSASDAAASMSAGSLDSTGIPASGR
ncbi:hypothetical protein C8J57DRAFT_1461276 [Mycena rebaudengoi]|nr:hypothetical protein C8J57DRAFT_1461276 [Mycena rebaudengoi]